MRTNLVPAVQSIFLRLFAGNACEGHQKVFVHVTVSPGMNFEYMYECHAFRNLYREKQ